MADIEVISENITELLTNTVNMSSVFYDMFLSDVPMDIELKQYNDKNELVSVILPNRAKDRKIALTGQGNPEGTVTATVGTPYVDVDTLSVYIKVKDDGLSSGWTIVFTQEGAESYIRNYLNDNKYMTELDTRRYLISNNYTTRADVKEELDNFKPILIMSPLPSFGELTLVDNEGYYIKPEGNVVIVLPSVTDTARLHSILVQVYITDTFVNNGYTFDFGTSIYFDQVPPNFSVTGSYNLIYEYDSLINTWVCGHITKGGF